METRIYEYDQLSRLAEVTIGGQPAETITYNPTSGNIYSKGANVYGYDLNQPHAVRSYGSQQTYSYDANGNMTSRTVGGTTYAMGYDAENRMTSISGGSLTARYVFDGDGRRVLSVVGDTRTLYVNEYFEVTMENGAKVNQDLTIEDVDICENRYCSFMPLAISDIEAIGMQNGNFGTRTFITEIMEPNNANVTWRIYYPGGGLRIQTASTNNLSYLVQDHINSTAMTLNNSGAVIGEIVYSAFGETRATYGTTQTKKLYTGQYEAEAGLYFYNARWFDNELGMFVQADSIIPDSLDPQSWDRYSYVNNNPINYNDPSGNVFECGYTTDMHCGSGSGPVLPVPIIQAPENALDNVWNITEGILSVISDPVDAILTVKECLLEHCSPIMLIGLISPAIPGSKIDEIIEITGQSHHILSTKIMKALNEHKMLKDIFGRDDLVVQARDLASHRGYQEWHRRYDFEIVRWLEINKSAGTNNFLNFLQDFYDKPEMQKRFPDAGRLLQMIIEELT